MLNLSHVMLYPLYVHGSFYVFLWFLSFHSSEKNKKKQAIKTVAAHQIFRLLVAKFHHGTRQGWHLRHNKTQLYIVYYS